MGSRAWKTIFVAIFSLMALIYAVQNVANLNGGMYASFAYVLGQADHVAYANSVVPAISHPLMIWLPLLLVLALEFISGGLMALGALAMWRTRNASSEQFNASKRHAVNGIGLAIICWFLLFGVMGGALFQMWQTQIGSGSYNGAFQFTVYGLVLFAIVSLED